VAPVYPPVARAAHAEGKVVIAVEIGSDGRVTSAKAKGNGMKLLVVVSQLAAKRWQFSPILKGKRSIDLTFIFRIVPKENEAVTFLPPYQIDVAEREPVIEKNTFR